MKQASLARRAERLSPAAGASHHGHGIPFDSGDGFEPLFPDLTAAAHKALTTYRDETLQYGGRRGLAELREWIAGYMNEDGARVAADEILITNGAKHGIELVCQLLLDEGDSLIVTAPTYVTAIPIFRSFGAQFVEVGQDAEGLDTDELRATLQGLTQAGSKLPKFIYNVPDFHNPTGITMTRVRREALLELASRYGIYVVEDTPYRMVRFEGSAEPTLKSLDRNQNVIHINTFSKLIAPGLRIGWVAAAQELIARMLQLKSDGGSSPLVQRIIVEWCKAGNFPVQAEKARHTYRSHRDFMVAAVRRDLPEASMVEPHGGYYVWLTFPADVDTDALATYAAEAGVTVIPGSKFYAAHAQEGAPWKNQVRLAFSHASPEQIDEGTRRLADALEHCRAASSGAPAGQRSPAAARS